MHLRSMIHSTELLADPPSWENQSPDLKNKTKTHVLKDRGRSFFTDKKPSILASQRVLSICWTLGRHVGPGKGSIVIILVQRTVSIFKLMHFQKFGLRFGVF